MAGPEPIVVLVEYQAPRMSPDEAAEVARQSAAVLRSVPGLVEARFLGDFEGGTHCFLLTWTGREAMETYMTSDQMHTVRSAASSFVEGRPTRRIFVDYTLQDRKEHEPA
jgi:quinol monooxygenase YgiN